MVRTTAPALRIVVRTPAPALRIVVRTPAPARRVVERTAVPVRTTPLRRLTNAVLTLLHWLAHVTHGALVLAVALLAFAAWRLAQGPVDVSWLTTRLEAGVNTPDSPVHVDIGHTALAWEGFRFGSDSPIDLRLTRVRVTDARKHQHLAVPQIKVSLSLTALLFGRLQPRLIELDNPRLTFSREPDGSISLHPGGQPAEPSGTAGGDPLPPLLTELARPPASDRSVLRGWLSQIRHIRIHDAAVTVQDRQLGAIWRAPQADIDLKRLPGGGIDGSADLALALGDQQARLHVTGSLSAAARQTTLHARLTAVRPAVLARATPRLAPLAALDAPLTVEASLTLGPRLRLQHAKTTLRTGSGTARIGRAKVPIKAAALTLDGSAGAARIDSAWVMLQPRPDGPATTLRASGTASRKDGQIDATLQLTLDHVAFADLPLLWPQGVGDGARAWITENITAGTAHDARVWVALVANDDLSDVTLTQASGTLDGSGLTVHWLRPIPPIEDGRAQLHILGPDTLEIAVLGGRQTLNRNHDTLAVRHGTVRVTGMMQTYQTGTINVAVAGALPDTLTLLRNPRLRLLSQHPLPVENPAGTVSATLSVHLPLENDVQMDDIAIHAAAELDGVHLDKVVAGRSLDQGRLTLDATNDGLSLKGRAQLAGIPAQLDAAIDFRAGGPKQVVERIQVSGRPDAQQLAAAGLDASAVLSGPVPLQADFTQQRNGAATLAVQADLTPAALQVKLLGWQKPAGRQAQASAQVQLLKDRLVKIDQLAVQGDGLSVQGEADCADGKVSLVRIDRLQLGRTDLHGTVRLPPTPASPIVVSLAGPMLDLSARLARQHQPTAPALTQPPPGPPWTLDARFDRVLLSKGLEFVPVSMHATSNGQVLRRLEVSGDTRPKGPFDLRITSTADGRRMTASAAQAGDLLRALGVTSGVEGGRLSVTGRFDDSQPDHPLNGTADLSDFRVREAAGLGKLLQAMTLYGLVDALRGPGLSFNRAIVPFRLTSHSLSLSSARAFSSSLGLTAKGAIDLDAERIDMQGTIVPAYFFNSLLGRVPLVGKLLSPEKGGGVFAASYTLRGRLDDPTVSVNPLSALTPGFLRDLFKGP